VALVTAVRKDFAYLGWCILLTYQYLLSQQGLQAWLLDAPRVDLFTANKEGLCSFLGYLAIFLFGLDIGSLLFSTHGNNTTTSVEGQPSSSNSQQLMMPLVIRCGLYWLCLSAWTLLFDADVGFDVSRRLANLPYVVWVIAFNLTLLTALIWVEQQMDVKDNQGPPLLNDLNTNGLATFLIVSSKQ
jgi:phosphatidylinositol glycan class W